MFIRLKVQRGLFYVRNLPRFSFLAAVLISSSFVQSQAQSQSRTDSGYAYHLSVGSYYFDLFRQHSEISRSTVFSKSSFASFSAASNTDSFSVSFRTREHFAAVDQRVSKFSVSFSNSQHDIDFQYSASWAFIDYSLSIGTPFNDPFRQLNYGIMVSADPFDQMLIGGIRFDRSPTQVNTSILFQDFLVPITENQTPSSIVYSIHSKPFRDLTTTIFYHESDSRNDDIADGYDITSHDKSIGKKLLVQYTFFRNSILSTEMSTDEFRTELVFNKDDLAFGDLLKGYGKYSQYSLNIHSDEMGLPISLCYRFEEFALSGLGHFESWPFTTLAASIIANRLNYQFNGFIKHHSIETTVDVDLETSSLSASLSYHRILSDAVLSHWEPEFLVFGVKNFISDPVYIRDIHLLGIGIRYDVSLFTDVMISANGEQYIPVSISYRDRISTGPSVIPSPRSSSPVTDGGRSAGITLLVKF